MEHETPVIVDRDCPVCMDNLKISNYVEYKTTSDSRWLMSSACSDCVESLRKSQFSIYVSTLANTKCAAEQRRMLNAGPPINLKDKHMFPSPDGEDKEICALWYADVTGGREVDPKLEGSLVGEERLNWWEEQKKFRIIEEKDHEGGH